MKLFNTLVFFSLLIFSSVALSANMYLSVSFGDRPVSNAEVKFDDIVIGKTDSQGNFVRDVLAGRHKVVLGRNEVELAAFSFVATENTDFEVKVSIPGIGDPVVNIRKYEVVEGEFGYISGLVEDEAGKPLQDVKVSILGEDQTLLTDKKGEFEIELPTGVHSVYFSHPEHGESLINKLRVTADDNSDASVQLSKASQYDSLENVVAIAKYTARPVSTVVIEKFATSITDAIDIKDLARFGDSSAASALKRVVGVSVVDDKFAVVRGLDGRYISSTLNSNLMPSTDPFETDVQLDLFPSNILGGIDIQKTYTADQPGNTTAGSIKISTRGIPEEKINKFSFSGGYTSGVSGDDIIDYNGKDQSLPSDINTATDSGFEFNVGCPTCEFTVTQAAELAQQFSNNYNIEETSAGLDFSLGYAYGNRTELEVGELGYYAAVDYKEATTARQDASTDDIGVETTYQRSKQSEDLSAYFIVGAEFDSGAELISKTIYLNSVDDTTRVESGEDRREGTEIDEVALQWEERQFISQAFSGKHFITNQEHEINWAADFSQTKRDEPDRRSYIYTNNVLSLSSVERRFSELTEDSLNLSADYALPINITDNIFIKLKFGFMSSSREREVDVARFGIRSGASPSPDRSQNIETLLSAVNFTNDSFRLRASTANTDPYSADVENTAYFFSTDTDIGEKTSINIGVRVEDFSQDIVYPRDRSPEPLESEDTLPSIGLTYRLNDELQFRAGYSTTVSRPDIVERSESQFYDEENRQVFGNPNLQVSEIDNFDLRAEYYFTDEESISLAYFIKDISNPIELGVVDGSGAAANGLTYRNNQEATISGVELDFKKNIIDSGDYLSFIAGNIAAIDSEITLSDDAARFEIDDKRDLQGQSPLLINAQLGLDHFPTAQKVTVLLNFFDDRIDIVGRNIPSEVEEGRLTVDVTYEKEFDNQMVIKAKIKNLLDSDVEYSRNGQIIETYKEGVSFSAGLTVNF